MLLSRPFAPPFAPPLAPPLVLAGSLLLLASCATPALEITPRFAQLEVDGEIGISTTSVSGENDLEDAGAEEDDSVVGVRADFKWGSPHLTVSTQSSTHEGDGTLQFDVSQGGTTIPAGANVATDIELAVHSAVLTFDLAPTSALELGLGFGVVGLDLDASFTEQGTGNQVETDQLAAIPVLAARLGFDVGRFDFSALVSGLSVKYSDDEFTFVDLDLAARLRIFGGDKHLAGFLAVGWRDVSAEVDYEDGGDEVSGDVGLSGPFVGLALAF